MAHPSFRGCEKRVLEAVVTLEKSTRQALRKHLTQGKLPISEAGVSRGLQFCLHNVYVVEQNSEITITEKGRAFFKEQEKKRSVSPVQ
jgi:hypothetical protein